MSKVIDRNIEVALRAFVNPHINFSAQYYYDLINYDDDWLEPRLTMNIDDEELLSRIFESYFELNIGIVLR